MWSKESHSCCSFVGISFFFFSLSSIFLMDTPFFSNFCFSSIFTTLKKIPNTRSSLNGVVAMYVFCSVA